MFSQIIIEKSNVTKMPWIDGDYPRQKSTSFYFKVSRGDGESLSKARELALRDLIVDFFSEKGVNVKGDALTQIISKNSDKGYSEEETFKSNFNFEYEKIRIAFVQVDEYWERTNNREAPYRIWILYEVANNPNKIEFEKINFTTTYGFSAVWRSALVPGWGQLFKKEKAKGIVILAGTGALILGAVISENQRSSYATLAIQTNDIRIRKDRLASADSWENIRNGLLVGVAGAYIYNVIDAFTSKGAKKYAYNQDRKINFYTVYLNNEFKAGLIYKF